MRLTIPFRDLRAWPGGGGDAITDEETGKSVGQILYGSQPEGRFMSLFDDKYRGSFTSHEEYVAFLKGVQSVLNHMIAIREPAAKRDVA